MTRSNPQADPPSSPLVALGTTLADLASTPDDRGILDDFATLLDVGPDILGPLMLTVLVEPLGGAQVFAAGHASPGLALCVDNNLDLRLVLPEPIEFVDGDGNVTNHPPERAHEPEEPGPDTPHDPVPANLAALGTTLAALASSSNDAHCLNLFADALAQGTHVTGPLLLSVLVESLAGAQISMVSNVRPGLRVQVDDDLQVFMSLPGIGELDN